MGNNFNFNECSLAELQKISAEIQIIIQKRVDEEEREAWEEFRRAFRKFRAKVPNAELYAEARCEGCDYLNEVEVLDWLEEYFNN